MTTSCYKLELLDQVHPNRLLLLAKLRKSTMFKPKLSVFLLNLHQSLAHQGLAKVSTYPLVCLRFSQTLLHQDLGTFLRKESLNLG